MDKMSNSKFQEVSSFQNIHKNEDLLFGLWKDIDEPVEDVVRIIRQDRTKQFSDDSEKITTKSFCNDK